MTDTKTSPVTVTIPNNIIQRVDGLAKADKRSRSGMIALILEDWLNKNNPPK